MSLSKKILKVLKNPQIIIAIICATLILACSWFFKDMLSKDTIFTITMLLVSVQFGFSAYYQKKHPKKDCSK